MVQKPLKTALYTLYAIIKRYHDDPPKNNSFIPKNALKGGKVDKARYNETPSNVPGTTNYNYLRCGLLNQKQFFR